MPAWMTRQEGNDAPPPNEQPSEAARYPDPPRFDDRPSAAPALDDPITKPAGGAWPPAPWRKSQVVWPEWRIPVECSPPRSTASSGAVGRDCPCIVMTAVRETDGETESGPAKAAARPTVQAIMEAKREGRRQSKKLWKPVEERDYITTRAVLVTSTTAR